MSLELDTILLDTDSTLEVVVEIDSAKRTDGTLKTWYYSTFPRETSGSETPANTTFEPYLTVGGTLGPLTQSLSEDILFNGLASNSPGSLTLLQQVIDNDQLSQLNDYVFAGYPVRIKIGRQTDLYASFVLFRTLTVNIDPIVQSVSNGIQAIFQLSSVLDRLLSESLILKRYVGIPTCAEVLTTSAVATSSYNAAHDLTSFTIMYKVRVASNPAAARNLISKSSGATNNNFTINYNTTGFIECQASLAGVGTTIHISGTSLADSEWHTIVWGLLDKTTSYLMIDGTIISTATPSATVNLPATGVRMARFLVGKHLDARIYNRYITPDEARGISAVRSDGLDLGCVACWRFDDGGSATAANDYSSTNADATWTGVLNTDYRWTFTDLGEPELAGKLYPLNVGTVLNAKATLIDSVRERYRGNVDARGWYVPDISTITMQLVVRSQGTVLTGGGVDYTAANDGNDGVFVMTTAEAEPVTYDLLHNGLGEENMYPAMVARELLIARTRLTTSNISNHAPMTLLAPWPCGYWTDQDTTAKQALQSILGESGICYYEDSQGSLFFDMLLDTFAFGPYGEPCLDLKQAAGNRVSWGDIADQSGSFTIACWTKLHIIDQTAYNWGFSEPNQGTLFMVQKGGLSGNYAIWFQAAGPDAGKIKFRTAGVTLSSQVGVIQSTKLWYFVAAVFDDSANTMKLYLGDTDTTVAEIASVSNASSPSTNSLGLMIGDSGERYPWMSVQHVHIWNSAKTLGNLVTLQHTPPVGNESGLSFYAPLNEGIGSPVDKVSSTSGTITGTPQWAPKFTVNLDETPSVKLTDLHHTHPLWNAIVKYAKNRFRMEEGDIDSGVSQNSRLALKSEGLDVKFEDESIRDRFRNAKKVVMDSPIVDLESSQRLLRTTVTRFGDDDYVGQLSFPPGLNISRLACGLQIGDEIGLIGTVPSQIQTSMVFKVVSVSPNPLNLSTNVVIWRSNDIVTS